MFIIYPEQCPLVLSLGSVSHNRISIASCGTQWGTRTRHLINFELIWESGGWDAEESVAGFRSVQLWQIRCVLPTPVLVIL